MAGLLNFFAPPGLLDFLAPRGLLDFDPSPALASYRRGRYRPADLLTGNQGQDSSGTGSLFDYRRIGLPSPDAQGSAWPDRLNSPPDALRRWAEAGLARRIRGDTDPPRSDDHRTVFGDTDVTSSPIVSDPFEAAAARVRNAATPIGGRDEGGLTRVAERLAPSVLWSLVTLPQRAFEASERMRLAAEYDPAILEASLLTLGAPRPLGTRAAGAQVTPQLMQNKSLSLFNPPPKPRRPFELDYPAEKWPDGVPVDATGRLTADVEGRRLTAQHVVGRRMMGGNDEAFPTAQLDSLTKALTGQNTQALPPSEMGRSFGQTLYNPFGEPEVVRLRNNLAPADAAKVHAHENGHVIDQIAGPIRIGALYDEFRPVYNTLNNPNRTRNGLDAVPSDQPFGPHSRGYVGEALTREYIVEAIRAYLADPNYLKSVAPKTATAIRAAVNANPRLRNTIQFNSIGGGFLGGGFMPTTEER